MGGSQEAENHRGPCPSRPASGTGDPSVSARPHPGHVRPQPTPTAAPEWGYPRRWRKTPPSQRQLGRTPTPSSRSPGPPPDPCRLLGGSSGTGSVRALPVPGPSSLGGAPRSLSTPRRGAYSPDRTKKAPVVSPLPIAPPSRAAPGRPWCLRQDRAGPRDTPGWGRAALRAQFPPFPRASARASDSPVRGRTPCHPAALGSKYAGSLRPFNRCSD